VLSRWEPVPPANRHSTMSRLLVAVLSLVLLAACGHPSRSGESVADYFSPAQPHPGPTWTRDGRLVDGQELNSIAGPDHCQWQSAVMMHLGWPLGTVSQTSAEIRQLIRDPTGVIDRGLRDKLALAIDLPADAQDTGYRNGELELWLSPSNPDAAYLRVGSDVERWPRAEPVVACA
jgi:hypothetical protein